MTIHRQKSIIWLLEWGEIIVLHVQHTLWCKFFTCSSKWWCEIVIFEVLLPKQEQYSNKSFILCMKTILPAMKGIITKTFTLTQSAILQHKLPNVQISHTMAFAHFPHYAKVNQWECCQNMNGNPRWFSISTRPLIRGSGNLTRGAVALKSVPSWDDQGGGSRSHKPSMRNSSKRQLKPSCAIKH